MANEQSLLENLSIYNDNLSVYYIGSILISLVSVLLTWWYHRYEKNQNATVNSQLSGEENYADVSIVCIRPMKLYRRTNNLYKLLLRLYIP